jgi:hypothetical protein
MRVLVTGVGRSGTTMLYQQIAKILQLHFKTRQFSYEPYLWDINTPLVGGNTFGMEQLSAFGMYVHQATPLFIQPGKSNELHDRFVRHLFEPRIPGVQIDAYLAKIIRGSGRLHEYIRLYPDIKIVACLRNPIDTINSSLGMFSFFGEEFHKSDKARFREEAAKRGVELPSELSHASWSGHWWREFTEATLTAAQDHPHNILPFIYEAYLWDKDAWIRKLGEFLGLDAEEGFEIGLSKQAGAKISSTHLLNTDIDEIYPHFDFYKQNCMTGVMPDPQIEEFEEKTFLRYVESPFADQIAASSLGRMTPIQLRSRILKGAVNAPFAQKKIDVASTFRKYSADRDLDWRQSKIYRPSRAATGHKRSVSCIVTCHNNSATIKGTLLSTLDQTASFREIVVVDDKSTDDSLKIVSELAETYRAIRVVSLPVNVGVSGARHIGILSAHSDYITQLDGDDYIGPTKNFEELLAIDGRTDVIAFTDYIRAANDGETLVDTSKYDDDNRPVFSRLLERLPGIPRDMTFARELYFAAGGYDLRLSLYEDWDLKLRLARCTNARWVRSVGVFGTIYNRLSQGLSGKPAWAHARWLTWIFMKAIDGCAISTREAANAFHKALRAFDDRQIAIIVAEWLDRLAADGTPIDDKVLKQATSRRIYAASQDEFLSQMREILQSPIIEARDDFVASNAASRSYKVLDTSEKKNAIAISMNETTLSADAVQLVQYYDRDSIRHLDILLHNASDGSNTWKEAKFKFKFSLNAPRRLLEFRQGRGWPAMFQEWPSAEQDRWGSLLQIPDRYDLADTISSWSAPDRQLLRLITALLPEIARIAATQKNISSEEADSWIVEAQALSKSVGRALPEFAAA